MADAQHDRPPHNPFLHPNVPHHDLAQDQYDYRPMIHSSADFAAHLQMAHIPLPLETPLPPSSYDFTSQGAFQLPHSLHGPQAHPLFEGVMAMHQALGHELNFSWSDVSQCSQPSDIAYSTAHSPSYACPAPLDTSFSQWSPPGSILDSTPSPIDYSQPATPEQPPEPIIETPLPEEFPQASIQPASHTSSFAIFPLVVSGTKTHEHTIAFQADRPKAEKGSSKLDPHAADFIREKLGDLRWTIFSSRLAERRTTTQKPKKPDVSSVTLSNKLLDAFSGDKSAGASAIDFLVKVEVVKSVLRTYVPHPYNPLKTLSHTYAPAPNGQVTLSRSTILALSGWSNTQFSYWARRAEAISVLGPHDTRLRTVAAALERRLRIAGLSESDSPPSSPSSSQSSSSVCNSDALSKELGMDPEDWVRMYVTGKGLDVIIDEVKKRTGVSPFLRGKHSSLDPFGSSSGDAEHEHGKKAVVYMPTFQAEKYVHEVPEVDPNALSSMVSGSRAGKRKATSPPPEGSDTDDAWLSAASDTSAEDAAGTRASNSPPLSLSSPLLYPEENFFTAPASMPPSGPGESQPRPSPTQTRFFEGAEPPQAVLPPSTPLQRQNSRGKKRRLAPAPTPQTLGLSLTESPRLYNNNHLETELWPAFVGSM